MRETRSHEFKKDLENSINTLTENNIYICIEYKQCYELKNRLKYFCFPCYDAKRVNDSQNLLTKFGKKIHMINLVYFTNYICQICEKKLYKIKASYECLKCLRYFSKISKRNTRRNLNKLHKRINFKNIIINI